MQTAVWMITYLVQNRGSFKHFGMLKCYLELTFTKGSKESLPLTDNKQLLKMLEWGTPGPSLTGQAENVDLFQGEMSNLE